MEAKSLYETFTNIEIATLLEFWCCLLARVEKTSKSLQIPTIDIVDSINLLNSLITFCEKLRNERSFKDFETKGRALIDDSFQDVDVSSKSPTRSRKRSTRYDYGKYPDTVLEGSNCLRIVTYYPVIDSILMELRERVQAMEVSLKPFNFLLNLDKLSDEEIRTDAKRLVEKYASDLDEGILLHNYNLIENVTN